MTSAAARRFALVIVAASMAASFASAASGDADRIENLLFDLQLVPLQGQRPAPFTLERLSGGQVTLSDLRGQVVLLYFWATW